MKTVYANTRHPKLVLWSSIAVGAIGLICLILYCVLTGDTLLFASFFSFFY